MITDADLTESAFPVEYDTKQICNGMTLRDYFASKAMQGFTSNPSSAIHDFNPDWEGYKGGIPDEYKQAAKEAYLMADAMMEARK